MSNIVVVGAQWGDEGKGKIVDYLSEEAQYVVRYNGGANAGHSVQIGDDRYKVHLMPSGVFRGLPCLIGAGCIVDPPKLIEEIKNAEAFLGQPPMLYVDHRAHIVMPYHKEIDALEEISRGDSKIGTTKTGNGPCYADKYRRDSLRMSDLLRPEDELIEMVEDKVRRSNKAISLMYSGKMLNPQAIAEDMVSWSKVLSPYIKDVAYMLSIHQRYSQSILFEGAHGTLLDIDFGTYPFVTSSSCTVGAIQSAGIGITKRDTSYGVAKAYMTRIGTGPFPSEMPDSIADVIREKGNEYGTTTGRPRRIGWLDLGLLDYSCRINGFDFLAVTMLDVLSGRPTIEVTLPTSQYRCIMPGWEEDISGCRSYQELPNEAKAYLNLLASCIDTPIGLISVGPARDQIIDIRDNPIRNISYGVRK